MLSFVLIFLNVMTKWCPRLERFSRDAKCFTFSISSKEKIEAAS